ncbi:sec-independent protein translocase protein TatA [Rhodoligotrophos appendicifer]|uniref:twin-arginine translocase TatA/TatE family subunit n=1 Tax=Rhodoligotrophos appendicifer TaxID=987056 RepID=UPI0011871DF9|nr:twin-arginine translocase TatA/TatE family subunit [Rhodoligotrophos appendicifer]
MSLSFSHLLILAVVVIVLFGRNKISDLMGDVAKGIKTFKKGMVEDEVASPPVRNIEHGTTVKVSEAAKSNTAG